MIIKLAMINFNLKGSDIMSELFEEVSLETAERNLQIVNCDVEGGCGIGCVNS